MPLYYDRRRTIQDFLNLTSSELKEELKKTYHRIGTLKYKIDCKTLQFMGEPNQKKLDALTDDIETLKHEIKESETDAELIFKAVQTVLFNEDVVRK